MHEIKIHILATVLVGKSIGGIFPKFRTHGLWVRCKEMCAKPRQDIRLSSILVLNLQSASLQAFFLSNCLEHGIMNCIWEIGKQEQISTLGQVPLFDSDRRQHGTLNFSQISLQ